MAGIDYRVFADKVRVVLDSLRKGEEDEIWGIEKIKEALDQLDEDRKQGVIVTDSSTVWPKK